MSPNTGRKWLDLLAATYQWFEVPPYHGNTIKRVSGKTKGYFSDTGFASTLHQISSPKALAMNPMLGPLFETWVVSTIRRLFCTIPSRPGMYHWRTAGGAEIDLVLELDDCLFPIEVKCKTHLSGNETRCFRAFRETYPKKRIMPGLILYAGTTPYRLNEL
ncbi:MAG TPA: DUF4143 domain-containing protein, partial [Candidatus Ozemobacteraceae bacterium]|nr:DUF4143 domain-containing protein [Candidatus Ozemobacteraceae bacterium]